MKKIFLLVGILFALALFKTEVSANFRTYNFTKNGLNYEVSVDDDFSSNEILVIVNDSSKIFYPSDFSEIDCVSVVEMMSVNYNESSNFKKIIKLQINSKSKSELLLNIEKIWNNSNIYFAEPNYFFEKETSIDAYASSNIVNALSEPTVNSYALDMIGAQEAWEISTGEGVLIGIMDSGIDNSHPDLTGRVSTIYSESFVSGDDDPFYDEMGHGTSIAGVIGAARNGIGLKGIAYNSVLSSLKISNDDTSSIAYVSNAIEALNLSILFGIDVINCSWGFQNNYMLYQAISNYNKLVVCSAGNNMSNIDANPTYPSGYTLNNIISVGAVDDEYGMFASNYGETSVDLFAPGYDIYSTYLEGKYANIVNFTSIAAAYVTGAVALLIDKYPTLSPVNIKNKLLDNVTPNATLSNKCVSGGVLNIYSALTN